MQEVEGVVVTQKRIAELLNIDRTTVTKALSGSPDISEALRARVKALCEELGYRPNYHSKSLRTRETRVISVLRSGLNLSHLHGLWMSHINYWAHDAGYAVRLESLASIDAVLAEQSADGFISLHGPGDRPELGAYVGDPSKPVVFTDCGLAELPNNSVIIDNAAGAAAAVSHLVELGHRAIAFCGMVASSAVSRDRLAGYIRQLNNLGLAAPDSLVFHQPRWPEGPEEMYVHEAAMLAAISSGVTAVIATSDIAAVGVIKVLRRAGISVPGDVAVVGFDDSLVARVCEPTLTSVQPDLSEAAREAVGMLLKVIRNRACEPNVLVPARLVVRESTVGLVQAGFDRLGGK